MITININLIWLFGTTTLIGFIVCVVFYLLCKYYAKDMMEAAAQGMVAAVGFWGGILSLIGLLITLLVKYLI